MFSTLNFWLSKTSMIFLLNMKKKIQLINHLETIFCFIMCISCFCRTLKNVSDMSSNNSVVILFFSSYMMQIWLSSNVKAVSVNLFWCALICCDDNMSCFLIMLWNWIVIITSTILFIIFSSMMNFQKLDFW